jgi:hypothetical protein
VRTYPGDNSVQAVPSDKVQNSFSINDLRDDEINRFIDDWEYMSPTMDILPNLSDKGKAAFEAMEKQMFPNQRLQLTDDEIMSVLKQLHEEDSNVIDDAASNYAHDLIGDHKDAEDYLNEIGDGMEYGIDSDGWITSYDSNYAESFSRGGVDENMDVRDQLSEDQQRVYDFYEKDISKYLKKIAPTMQKIVDPQGVEWFQIPVDPAKAKEPINAFAKKEEDKNKQQSATA